MDNDHVGEWVRRVYEDRRYRDTKLHLVESKINQVYILKCGKRLPETTNAQSLNKLVFRPDPYGWDKCYHCG